MSNVTRNGNTLLLKDIGQFKDTNEIVPGGISLRGEVEIGYGLHTDPITGISSLGESILKSKNEILMGGSLFALEKLFNAQAQPTVSYLNDIMGFGTDGDAITEKYPKNTCLCLFDIGLGGCGDAYTDVKAILQQQRQLPGMIPFRVVDEPFEKGSAEASKYFMMVRNSDGKYWYYGKTFAKEPIIKALWKNGGDGKDGTAVVESDYSSVKNVPIETFAEAVLSIEVTDLREYFELYQDIKKARFNSLGLCSGIKGSCYDDKGNKRDEYKQVLQFSGLNFTNEPLHMNKTLSCIYRVYSA